MSDARPTLRVVRGAPDAEELAVLVAVVASLRQPERPKEPERRSAWSNRAALARTPLAHGPGAWRASGLPGG